LDEEKGEIYAENVVTDWPVAEVVQAPAQNLIEEVSRRERYLTGFPLDERSPTADTLASRLRVYAKEANTRIAIGASREQLSKWRGDPAADEVLNKLGIDLILFGNDGVDLRWLEQDLIVTAREIVKITSTIKTR